LIIPESLVASCKHAPERKAWLESLPHTIRDLQEKWHLSLGDPFAGDEVSCSWVAPALCADGARAILKLGMPHMEGADEIKGLRFWNGDPTVRLLEADESCNAMLLERCEPGTRLRDLPEPEQDVVIAGLLRRLWRTPENSHPFRPLAQMLANWAAETRTQRSSWPDAGLVEEGLRLFQELSRPAPDDVLLATDLHAGNVLQSQRDPWLVIDPKPFLGDRAYDATQHLKNCRERMQADPLGLVRRFADLLKVDDERVQLWMFARSAAEPRDTWDGTAIALARMLV
jgi:streptomycin 6-kinase